MQNIYKDFVLNIQSRSSLAEKQADASQTRGDHPDFNQRAPTADQSAALSLRPNGSYGTNVGHLGQTLCPLLALVNVSPSKPRRWTNSWRLVPRKERLVNLIWCRPEPPRGRELQQKSIALFVGVWILWGQLSASTWRGTEPLPVGVYRLGAGSQSATKLWEGSTWQGGKPHWKTESGIACNFTRWNILIWLASKGLLLSRL